MVEEWAKYLLNSPKGFSEAPSQTDGDDEPYADHSLTNFGQLNQPKFDQLVDLSAQFCLPYFH